MRVAQDDKGRTVTLDAIPKGDPSGMAFVVHVEHPQSDDARIGKQAPEVHRFASEKDADAMFDALCNALSATEA